MAINDSFVAAESGIANGGSLTVEGVDSGTGAVEITELGGTGDAEVYKEVDTNADGSYDVSILIADPNDPDVPTSGIWHTQDNNLTISASNNMRLRVANISGGSVDFFATGFEVDD